MKENYEGILNRLKIILSAKSDADVARGLEISTAALSAFKKQGKFPYERIVKFCLARKISVEWLLTGEGPMERDTYNKVEGKFSTIAKESAIYNNVKGDPDLEEILQYFIENPQDKRFCLKMIKGKKEIKEAVEGFASKDLIKEEG